MLIMIADIVVSPPLQEHAIRFLYILVFGDDINAALASLKVDINPPPPEPFEFEMFDLLLDLLRVAFDTYFQNAKVSIKKDNKGDGGGIWFFLLCISV